MIINLVLIFSLWFIQTNTFVFKKQHQIFLGEMLTQRIHQKGIVFIFIFNDIEEVQYSLEVKSFYNKLLKSEEAKFYYVMNYNISNSYDNFKSIYKVDGKITPIMMIFKNGNVLNEPQLGINNSRLKNFNSSMRLAFIISELNKPTKKEYIQSISSKNIDSLNISIKDGG